MTPTATTDPPSLPPMQATLQALREAEESVDRHLTVFESRTANSYPDLARDAREIVEESVFMLEVMLLTAILTELAGEYGVESYKDRRLRSPEALAEIGRRMRCDDLETVFSEHLPPILRRVGKSADELEQTHAPIAELKTIERAVEWAVAACPIGVVEAAARFAGMEEKGHRCRVAYDALRAFLRRVSPERKARVDAVGRAYARGKLSIEESAQIMGVAVQDAIAEFERLGHWRSPEVVQLSEEKRAELLSRLRQDRIDRQGRPRGSADRALRSALASARIEDVDARPWLRTKKR